MFAAPGAAGVLDQREPLLDTLGAFVCFCLAASGTYFLNDARDAEADRLHPTKRNRPVAAGMVPVGLATVAGGRAPRRPASPSPLAVRPASASTVAAYVALTTAYSIWLKHIAVVDVVAVAAGFVLRAIAGAAATGVPISEWFFIVTSFGSLFMVVRQAGRRGRASSPTSTSTRRRVRPSLRDLHARVPRLPALGRLLRRASRTASGPSRRPARPTRRSLVPAVDRPLRHGLLRYALVLDQGRGSAPEEVVLSDRILQVIGVVWASSSASGVQDVSG